jgi:hypothetical protein
MDTLICRKNNAREKRRQRVEKLRLKRLKIPRVSTRVSIRRGRKFVLYNLLFDLLIMIFIIFNCY